jgi:hypothetical protein
MGRYGLTQKRHFRISEKNSISEGLFEAKKKICGLRNTARIGWQISAQGDFQTAFRRNCSRRTGLGHVEAGSKHRLRNFSESQFAHLSHGLRVHSTECYCEDSASQACLSLRILQDSSWNDLSWGPTQTNKLQLQGKGWEPKFFKYYR